jgi:hypothetical protein
MNQEDWLMFWIKNKKCLVLKDGLTVSKIMYFKNYFASHHFARTLKQYDLMNIENDNKLFNCSRQLMADMFSFIKYKNIFNDIINQYK